MSTSWPNSAFLQQRLYLPAKRAACSPNVVAPLDNRRIPFGPGTCEKHLLSRIPASIFRQWDSGPLLPLSGELHVHTLNFAAGVPMHCRQVEPDKREYDTDRLGRAVGRLNSVCINDVLVDEFRISKAQRVRADFVIRGFRADRRNQC